MLLSYYSRRSWELALNAWRFCGESCVVMETRCLISDGCVIEFLPAGQTRPAQLTQNALVSYLLSVCLSGWLFVEGKLAYYSYFFSVINHVYCTYFSRQVDSNIILPKILRLGEILNQHCIWMHVSFSYSKCTDNHSKQILGINILYISFNTKNIYM